MHTTRHASRIVCCALLGVSLPLSTALHAQQASPPLPTPWPPSPTSAPEGPASPPGTGTGGEQAPDPGAAGEQEVAPGGETSTTGTLRGTLRLEVAGAPRQGGFLLLRGLFTPAPSAAREPAAALQGRLQARLRSWRATCSWLGVTYPASSLEDEPGVWRAVVPVPTTAPTGRQEARLTIGPLTAAASVQIRRHAYPHQAIWLPTAMLATYDTPRAKADDARLLREIKRYIPAMLWRGTGGFAPPCHGRQSTPFGVRRTYNGWRKGWHRGQDLAVGSGTVLHAPATALVGITAPGLLVDGNAVVLHHGLGVASLYLHMSRFGSKPGQALRRGEAFGWSGGTGAGTGPHLHWATYVHGVPVEPGLLYHLPAGWR